jgi:hypothetical protein
MATYYVYENRKGKKATIHHSTCTYCIRGRQAQSAAGARSGQWLGPFHDFRVARDAARQTGQSVTACKACRPR